MEDRPRRTRVTRGEHRHGSRFSNPHKRGIRRKLYHLLLWQLGFYNDREPFVAAPEDFVYPNGLVEHDPSVPHVTWINHSTFLVEVDGAVFLTDPVWAERVSPFRFIGPKRHHPPPIALAELPRVDYVLISHNHYDHLDLYTVKQLTEQFPEIRWYAPLGVGECLQRAGAKHVVELDWWEAHSAAGTPHIEVHAVPAQHYSGRGLLDHNSSLWAGFVVQVKRAGGDEKHFYFAGDTGYNEVQFKEIGEEFPDLDLSLIPIGAYHPTEFMSTVHVCPEQAVDIHTDVNSRLSLGSHWGTFRLSSEPRQQPPYDLYLAMNEKGLPIETFRAVDPGQSINW